MTPHIRALWYNRPRRRRHFAKSLVDWQHVYDVLMEIVGELDTSVCPFVPEVFFCGHDADVLD